MEESPIRSREELANLYRRHVAMVYQICLMMMKNVPDAEDTTQTVFQKAMEYKKPFRDPEHEKAWLITTARNQCRDQLKHWWRTRRAGGGGAGAPDLGAAGGRRTVGADPGSAGEGADDPLPALLPGVQRSGDGTAAGSQARHGAHLALSGQREAESLAGGGRVWNNMICAGCWTR